LRLIPERCSLAEQAIQPLDDFLEVDRLAARGRRTAGANRLQDERLVRGGRGTAILFAFLDVVAGEGKAAQVDGFRGYEPLRDCRRLFGFSYAAMGVVSSMA
jgi:hypothetical protein